MELPGSTVTGRPGQGRSGLRRLAVRVLCAGRGRLPPGELATLLLPMVRRALRTERGPAAVVGWLRQCPGERPGTGHPTERAARKLAEALARHLVGQPDPDATLGDVSQREVPDAATDFT